MTTQISSMEVFYSSRGIPSYRQEIWHRDLKKHRVVKGNDSEIVGRKVALQVQEWDAKWAAIQYRETHKRRQQSKKDNIEAQRAAAAERSAEASAVLASMEQLLAYTLTVND